MPKTKKSNFFFSHRTAQNYYFLVKCGSRTLGRQGVRHPGFLAKKIKLPNSLTLRSSAAELLENLIKKINLKIKNFFVLILKTKIG